MSKYGIGKQTKNHRINSGEIKENKIKGSFLNCFHYPTQNSSGHTKFAEYLMNTVTIQKGKNKLILYFLFLTLLQIFYFSLHHTLVFTWWQDSWVCVKYFYTFRQQIDIFKAFCLHGKLYFTWSLRDSTSLTTLFIVDVTGLGYFIKWLETKKRSGNVICDSMNQSAVYNQLYQCRRNGLKE